MYKTITRKRIKALGKNQISIVYNFYFRYYNYF